MTRTQPVASRATLAPPPVHLVDTDCIAKAKIALALGQLDTTRSLLADLTAQRAHPGIVEAFALAAEACLEERDLDTARSLIRQAASDCGFGLADYNAGSPGIDYTTAQLKFDADLLNAQSALALGQAPEPVWFNQAIYSPDGVFCLADQRGRRLMAFDSGGHLLWGKQLPARQPADMVPVPTASLLLSQRPDEGVSYIDNHYRDFARLNRFATYQALSPLGERKHIYGSFTQDFFGNVYATCGDGHTIAIYTEDGTPIKEIALSEIQVPKPVIPFSILGDDEGHIYLYDTQVLVVLNRYGHVLFMHKFPAVPIPAALKAGLPGGMHLTTDGHLWLVRPQEGRIIKVHPEREEIVDSIGPNLSTGPLVFPIDVLSDWSEHLYIVDAGAGRVIKLLHGTEAEVLFERPFWTGSNPWGPSERPAIA
ncbi:MAG: hypothetical protein ABI743_00540 [bacterium]